MRKVATPALLILVFFIPMMAGGKRASVAPAKSTSPRKAAAPRSKSSSARVSSTGKRSTNTVHRKPAACAYCTRDNQGRIKRSSSARTKFQKSNPCPSTGRRTGRCPGYVIDHVTPLKRGGDDHPSNMQWQTVAAAKQKDKIE